MISDFLVQHPSGPFFNLSQSEYDKALVKYPQVSISSITYFLLKVQKLNFSLFFGHVPVSK